METETLIKLLPPTITLIMTSLFGLLVGVLVEKFKNRFRIIEYSINSQKIIPPLSQNLGGQLTIKLNEREIKTLKVITVEIENKNSIDFENLVVKFTLGANSWFQGNEAFIANNFSWLYWTPDFATEFSNVVEENNNCENNPDTGLKIIPDVLQRRIDYVLANRNYLIPVFNRKEKAVFNFLIEDPIDGTEGHIFPSVIHKSVNFIEKSDDEKQKQKDLWISFTIGVVIVAVIIFFVIQKNTEQSTLIIWSAIVGFSYSFVGYGLLYGFRRIKTFFN
ncbi:hypothetical protein [uncultured Draconibacterium sp.]|uniref:hypothetical protein n=1 Tax=uncultured Draconibacterium sp. TaxID=1573823 RepID=UPI0029C90858|nr:hypothetical protein [uncultured Draconibacterium sp.]